MIQLVLSAAPIDEVPGKMMIVTFFEDIRPLKGSTGLLDWRLNGWLSRLILQEKIAGSFAESLMMPSQGRVAADEILLFGLGPSSQLSEAKLEDGFSQMIQKLAKLRSPTFVISLGDLAKDFMGWRSTLRGFMTAMSQKIGKEDVEVVCAEEARWIHEARRRNMDFGTDVELTYAS